MSNPESVKRPDWYTSSLSEQMSLALDEEKPGWSDADVCFAIARRLERTGYRIILAACYDRDITALSTALDTAIEERDEMYKSYNAIVLLPKLRAATAENKRLRSLLRELRVHLREGSIERLRIDAALEDTHDSDD